MSKKRHVPHSSSASRKQKRQRANFTSLIIPTIVGLVVLAVIVGVIVSAEDRQLANTTSPAVSTAQALNTGALPYPDVPRISLADAQNELAKGQAVLIDVRSKSSYDSEHAAGAISMPEEEVNARLNELPRDKDLILYCT
jgi:hypothetical protein